MLFQSIKDQHRGDGKQSKSIESAQTCSLDCHRDCKAKLLLVRTSKAIEITEWLNLFCKLFRDLRSIRRSTPVPPRESPIAQSGGPSPRDGGALRKRSKSSSRDRVSRSLLSSRTIAEDYRTGHACEGAVMMLWSGKLKAPSNASDVAAR